MRVYRALGAAAGVLAVVMSLAFVPSSPVEASPAEAAVCSCVTYLQKNGLMNFRTSTGSAADSGADFEAHGYGRWNFPSTPPEGSIMVFDRGAMTADSDDGHIAVVRSAWFDRSAQQYVVTVHHAGWSVGSSVSNSECSNVRETTFRFSYPDGVTFYQRY